MTPRDELDVHFAWIGLLQPVGVVVSPPALAQAQCWPDRDTAAARALFESFDGDDFPRLTRELLGWAEGDLVPLAELPTALTVVLREYGGETLAPTWAVPAVGDVAPDAPESARWQCLVYQLPLGWDLDTAHGDDTGGREGIRFHASPQVRFERLLREVGVPVGVLTNGTSLRLVYRPAGESSGHLTFPFALLRTSQGAPALAALRMLLSAERLFSLPAAQRLPSILRSSRQFQNQVSTQLAGQVLDALWALLRGFQTAHAATEGKLLRDLLDGDRDAIYGGLLAVLLRLVFLLYAEDQDLLPKAPWFTAHYAVRGLFEALREDAGRHPDTMDLRHGAWPRLLALFRLVHDGGGTDDVALPARYGRLFDPDAYPFLEGRPHGSVRSSTGGALALPRVADGVVLRVLEKLVMLDGERLSYRALDVEQLGSVYESMMGFTVETATGPSIALTPAHVVVDLAEVLAKTGAARLDALAALADCELSGKAADAVKAAGDVDTLVAALGRRVSHRTPEVLPPGAMYLQPTAERRRSGSHYTPRALSEPIVRRTLEPVLQALEPKRAGSPSPEAIEALKVCDPAMGSGAFLVEACRYLAERLAAAWAAWDVRPLIPPDEDELLFARRRVAQRCLYGVDRNPFAVDLARLSLWLVTLAREHPFTFVDHALRAGDSLVGLGRDALQGLSWRGDGPQTTLALWADVDEARRIRAEIHRLADEDDTGEKRRLLRDAEAAVAKLRRLGDALVGVFFSERKAADRKDALAAFRGVVEAHWGEPKAEALVQRFAARVRDEHGQAPFHWEVEFPEVFGREKPGFDAVVGNPPFIGGTTIKTKLGAEYHDALMTVHDLPLGNADVAAFFLRRAFHALREGGAFGLISTNSIAQGDTRVGGLQYVRAHGGTIYDATRRYVWPGEAAVVVSIMHVMRGGAPGEVRLDGRKVERITSYLFHAGGDEAPARLDRSVGRGYVGAKIWGAGFVFEASPKDEGNTLETMRALIEKDPRNREVIDAYMGGEEFNASPTLSPHRWVINFGEMTEGEAARWTDLFEIVRTRVKPVRDHVAQRDRREIWWRHSTRSPEAAAFRDKHGRHLALSQVSSHLAVAFVPKGVVYANTLTLLLLHTDAGFAVVQSRLHEVWARFFGSTMKDDLRYTPSDCFETFPFPPGVLAAEEGDAVARALPAVAALEAAGHAYHEHRAAMMVATGKGLTETYNRFHDPDDTAADVVALRALRAAMDRAALVAYGWDDLAARATPEYLEENPDAAEAEGEGKRRKKRRQWRLRWPDALRDEVIARLLERNRAQAAAELAARQRAEAEAKAARKLGRAAKAPVQMVLIEGGAPDGSVGAAVRARMAKERVDAKALAAARGISQVAMNALLACELPMDAGDVSGLALVLQKTTGVEEHIFRKVLESLAQPPRQPRRAREFVQTAAAARRKEKKDEP